MRKRSDAMKWDQLPRGLFTGIPWKNAGAADGFDPYLVWAEADRFEGFGGTPRWLPIALETCSNTTVQQLSQAASRSWLQIPKAYLATQEPWNHLRFCTARVRPEFFKHIESGGKLHGLVLRFELGLPAGDQATRPGTVAHAPPKTAKEDATGQAGVNAEPLKGKVFGLIDDSLALAHANFLSQGHARTAHFWRQDGQGLGSVPDLFGYGHELNGTQIDAAMRARTYGGMVDESAVYADLGLSPMGRKHGRNGLGFHALDTSVSHGTHVADIAAGPRGVLSQIAGVPPHVDAPPSWNMANDDASHCAMVAVQLDYDAVRDTSGGSLNVHVLDGLMYILSRCDAQAEIVVNISFGTLAGPHDGTALLEAAMDQLIELAGARLRIVLAAGNSYQLRTHANVTLSADEHAELHWRVQPDDATQSFLELWIGTEKRGLTVEITPPGRDPLPPLALGESRMWTDGGAAPLCALVYPARVATGRNGTCALLALAPTFSFRANQATCASGVWAIRLINQGATNVTVDAYVERDDVVIGTRSGAKQSHFEDRQYDTSGDLSSFLDTPVPNDRQLEATLIRRSGNFNSIATGGRTTSAGGTRVVSTAQPGTGSQSAHYSPKAVDADIDRIQRPHVSRYVDKQAFSDENGTLLGLRAAGTRSSGTVRLQGTSDAAPQVARRLL